MTGRQWVAAGYAGVFVLGALAGGLFAQWRVVRKQAALFDRPGHHATYIWSLDQRLSLDSPQEAKIEAILARYDPLRARVVEPVEGDLVRVRTDMRREIRSVLNADQQHEFDELSRKHDEERERRRANRVSAGPAASVHAD